MQFGANWCNLVPTGATSADWVNLVQLGEPW